MDIDYEVLYDIIENGFYYKNTDLSILATISTANGKEDVSINSDRFEFQKAGVTIEMSTTSNNSRYIRLSLEKTE
ncbi:MAG: hypothetical protein K2N87_20130 [Eubacterium sp.]|nr:hypothetical protein [Eubacterium sp.]